MTAISRRAFGRMTAGVGMLGAGGLSDGAACRAPQHTASSGPAPAPGRAAFRRASASPQSTRSAPASNFVFEALHETRDLVAAALGDDRPRELRAAGAAMSMDEAASYAIANIDSKL